MAGLFKDESALEDGDGEAANAAMVSARMTEDQELLRHILESEGFYDASIQSRLEQPNGDNDRLTAILKVVPGQRYALGDIVIQAKRTTPKSEEHTSELQSIMRNSSAVVYLTHKNSHQ